jgi:hypothetical protein
MQSLVPIIEPRDPKSLQAASWPGSQHQPEVAIPEFACATLSFSFVYSILTVTSHGSQRPTTHLLTIESLLFIRQ